MRDRPSSFVLESSQDCSGPLSTRRMPDSPHADIDQQALAWFVRLQSGATSAAERAGFDAWVARDPAHRRAVDRLAALWSDLDAVADPRRIVVPLPAARAAPGRFMPSRRQFLAAGTAAAACAGLVYWTGATAFLTSDFRTATAGRRRVDLPDGSQVELDADTAIAVDFTTARRRVDLQQGRAYVFVADADSRPFDVVCADGVTTAQSAAFVIHRRARDVAVAVVEGTASVAWPRRAASATEARLFADQRLAYGPTGLGAVENTTGRSDLAWRNGRLVFEDQPLRQVIADLNRYREGAIVVLDSGLLDLRISGTFDIRQPDRVLDAIRSTLPVRSVALTRFLVVLRAA